MDWDEMYSGADRVWSGRPNGSLVAEVTGLQAGRALDVGCGEGADAVWLAGQGWQVTALDVSGVALGRAAPAATAAGGDVTWLHSGLLEADLPIGSFDLVSAQYAVLPRTDDRVAERRLLDLVAPGGTLLVVHHDLTDFHAEEHGHDPAEFVMPSDVAAALDASWVVEVDGHRDRELHEGAGAGHSVDVVLRARKLSA